MTDRCPHWTVEALEAAIRRERELSEEEAGQPGPGALTERRPHWDDNLIDAVTEAGHSVDPPYWLENAQTFRVIAAVEDWQIARMKGYLGQEPVGILTDLGNAEAAIARVRELHRTGLGEPTPGGSICWGCGNTWPCPTIKVLDGDS